MAESVILQATRPRSLRPRPRSGRWPHQRPYCHYRLEREPGGFPTGGLFTWEDIHYGLQAGVWAPGTVFYDLVRDRYILITGEGEIQTMEPAEAALAGVLD